MSFLNKEDIAKCEDLPTKVVDMSEWWGGDVKISVFSVGAQLHISKAINEDPDNGLFHWVIAGCVEPTFTVEDIPLLKSKNPKSILHLYEEISSLNKQSNPEDNLKNS